jgi:hypothetical protein
MNWFKPKVDEVVVLPKDKDGFYIDGRHVDQPLVNIHLNGGPEFKDFAKGLDYYNPTDGWGFKYLGTAINYTGSNGVYYTN